MRRIVFILMLLPALCKGQNLPTGNPANAVSRFYGGITVDSLLRIPVRDTGSANALLAIKYPTLSKAGFIVAQGSTIYIHNGTAWAALSGSGSGGVSSFNSRTGAVSPQSGDYSSFYYPLSGNPSGFLTSFTETDPTVPSNVKAITGTNISNWNTAYGWGNHATAGYVPSTRAITAGTGLSGGGDLSADRTLSLANTAVTPGSYTSANITVDAQGRLTAAASGSGGGITGSGTNNQLPKWTGSTALGNSIISDDATTATITSPATTVSAVSLQANSLTTGTALNISLNALRAGAGIRVTATNSNPAISNQKGIDVNLTGDVQQLAPSTYAGYFSNTHLGGANYGVYGVASGGNPGYGLYGVATSAANNMGYAVTGQANNASGANAYGGYFTAAGAGANSIAGYFSASGSTNNYGLIVNSGRVGIGTTTPVASAIVEIASTTQGVLEPRMTTTDRNNIVSPAEGLRIYNLTTHTYNFYNGTAWKEIAVTP